MLPKKNRSIETTDTVELIGSGGQIIRIEYFSLIVSWGETFWFHALKPLVSSNETNGFNL